MLRRPLLLACASLGYLAACNSDNSHPTLGADAAFDTGSDGTPSEAGNDASDGRVDAPTDALPDASTDVDAGSCTASIDTFNCLPTYPSTLSAACGATPAGVAFRERGQHRGVRLPRGHRVRGPAALFVLRLSRSRCWSVGRCAASHGLS